jgi:lysophospholipase L1-like esterase
MMMRTLLLGFVLLAFDRAAHASTPAEARIRPDAALQPISDQVGLPRVLLIGDSISIGYTVPVRELLRGQANVHRVPTNASSSGYGLQLLDRWLGDGKWDVIHFNFGIHDAKLPPEGIRHASVDLYTRNLRQIVARLKRTGARLIWASSTPIPLGGNLRPNRRFADIDAYNTAAKAVMTEEGIAINDLNAAITPQAAALWVPRDLHFIPEGYALLARQVAEVVRAALPRN